MVHLIYGKVANVLRVKALAPLDKFPRIFLENKKNSLSEAETRNSTLSHSVIRDDKKSASSRNFRKREENDQRNILVEPKQENLKMIHFSRIERKFQWNQLKKVLMLIPANHFSNDVTLCKTE